MNAGKTTTLLQSNYNYHERGMDTLLFKPAIDIRESCAGIIQSRIGIQASALLFDPLYNFHTQVQAIVLERQNQTSSSTTKKKPPQSKSETHTNNNHNDNQTRVSLRGSQHKTRNTQNESLLMTQLLGPLVTSTIPPPPSHKPISCLLVDEAQFLTKEQVRQLTRIVDELHIPVLTYGLRSDFQGNPFEGSIYLLSWADVCVEIKTICYCGAKASMNLRIEEDDEGHRKVVKEGKQVEIGGNDRYVAVCRKHFYESFEEKA